MNALLLGFASAAAFSCLYRVPLNQIWRCGLGGACGWLIFTSCQGPMGQIGAAFVASSAVAVYSEVVARIVHQPVTVFLIPGVIPLVPGGAAYVTMLSFLQNEYDQGFQSLVAAAFLAGAIAGGIIVVSSVFRALVKRKHGREAVM